MRKKLILLILLMLTIILTLLNMNKGGKFIKDAASIQLITTKGFTKSDTLIKDSFAKDSAQISSVLKKYEYVEASAIKACDKNGTATIVSQETGFNVVAIENSNSFEYYKEKSNGCELIGKISDVKFTENIVEAYANDSIYTSFESNNNFEISGMVKVKDDEVTSIDTLDNRYTNPTAFSNGVLMIQNNKNVVAFDKDDKVIFQQNNSKSSRQILALNVIDNSLFLIIKDDNKVSIEGYNIEDKDSFISAKPAITYEITKYIGNVGSEITTKKSNSYASFTTNNNTIVVSKDLAKVIVLEKYNTTLGFNGSDIIVKKDENYYVFNLDNNTFEDFGKIKALNFKFSGNSIVFEVLNKDGKSEYIKFNKG
ncbi:hypothetical protein [Mycoplasma sp. P36-A1]|uniref:hypothetical protein n=1 Tax=Mycoplasma sp. P36-A1 TaxID=3252900 RepID=UPI003C2C7964